MLQVSGHSRASIKRTGKYGILWKYVEKTIPCCKCFVAVIRMQYASEVMAFCGITGMLQSHNESEWSHLCECNMLREIIRQS